jgi:hypothetical protein
VAAFSLVAITGNIYSGLWYPVGVAAIAAVIGALFLPETVPLSSAPASRAAPPIPNAR